MFCKNCGVLLEEDALFCQACGCPVEGESRISAEADEDKTELYTMPTVETVVSEETSKTDQTVSEEPLELKDTEASEPEETEALISEAVHMESSGENGTAGEAEKKYEVSENMRYCPNCGMQNAASDSFCQNCGIPLNQIVVQQRLRWTGKSEKEKKKTLSAFIGVGVLAAAVAMVVILFKGMAGTKNTDELFYLKDNEVMSVSGKKNEPRVIVDNYYENAEKSGHYTSYRRLVQYTSDGKYIFYQKNIDENEYGDLYYRKTSAKEENGEKLDSDINEFIVIEKDKILYRKGMDNRLYFSDLENREKLGSDVYAVAVSSDNKYIMWEEQYDTEYRLYMQNTELNAEKEKVDTIDRMEWFSDDFRTLVYWKNDALYVCNNFSDKTKLSSDVESVYVFELNDNVEIYYLTADEAFTVYDFVEDEKAESDAAMKEPRIEDYQSVTVEDSFWGPREVTHTDDMYYEMLNQYEEKLGRDSMREYLKSESFDVGTKKIYQYVPGEKNGELIVEFTGDTIGSSSSIISYMEINYEDFHGPEMSDGDTDFSKMIEKIMKAFVESAKIHFVNNAEIVDLPDIVDIEDIENVEFHMNRKTDEIYLLERKQDGEREGEASLLTWKYKKSGEDWELLAENVGWIPDVTDDGIYYTCEEHNGSVDLYLNNTRIDSDVLSGSIVCENGQALYLTDADGKTGTLYYYDGTGEPIKIADDVAARSYDIMEEKRIPYLTDYSFNRYEGDLMIYNGKSSMKVDSDVTCVFLGSTSGYRGYLN